MVATNDNGDSAKLQHPDTNKIITSPWAAAIPSDRSVIEPFTFPDLHGMKVMIIVPNDYYRKKLMPLGPGYIATALSRCSIDVSVMDCAVFSYDDIEIAKKIQSFGKGEAKNISIGSGRFPRPFPSNRV